MPGNLWQVWLHAMEKSIGTRSLLYLDLDKKARALCRCALEAPFQPLQNCPPVGVEFIPDMYGDVGTQVYCNEISSGRV